jgi:hypothetical protein
LQQREQVKLDGMEVDCAVKRAAGFGGFHTLVELGTHLHFRVECDQDALPRRRDLAVFVPKSIGKERRDVIVLEP